MDLSHKVKIAFDEMRILILGAQILLGSSFAVSLAMVTRGERNLMAHIATLLNTAASLC